MAEAVVTFAAEGIVSNLISAAAEQIALAWGLEDELTGLQDSMAMIHDVLYDAEERQVREKAVKRWLLKLKKVAYKAEDLLDELVYEDLQRRFETNDDEAMQNWVKQVQKFFSLSNPVLFRFMMANKVKKINKSLDKIKNEGIVLGLNNRVGAVGRIIEFSQDSETDSFLDSEPVGRKDDVSKIVNMLSTLRNQHEISVISIVGMAGLGKTTLAKSACKEVKEKNMFDVVIWVRVSDNFSHRKILGGMLEYLDRSAGGMSNIDAILQNLQKELRNKSFLLVLDDVWSEDCQKWCELKNRLSKLNDDVKELSPQQKANANAIVVTTRSQNVASIMETSPHHRHHLGKLSAEECWSIIKERAFGDKGALISSDLEDIGRVIAEKCGGLPLLARVLGGTLGSNCGKEEWLKIKNSDVWDVENNDKVLLKLKLSFDNLPFCLKQCFAYCSIFPKGHLIEKDQLIQLWMAQDFLHSFEEFYWHVRNAVSLEEIGDKCFNSLLASSLFQEVERDSCGNIKTCKMHDVVHDLALFVSKPEVFTSQLTNDISAHVRHLNVGYNEEFVPKISKDVARKLRSLFSKVNIFNDMLRNFRSLRVLNFCEAMIKHLPAFLGRFKHLRYLDVSGTSITELPQSVDRLYNLQTLRFMHCRSLQMLPKRIRNLVNLRHIYFNDEKLMPVQIGCLLNLQTLPLFVVSRENGCQMQELEYLNLRGELKICKLEHVKDGEEARGANLEKKMNLYKLIYEWSSERESLEDDEEAETSDAKWSYKSFNYDEEVLEELQSYSSDQSFSHDEVSTDSDEREGFNHDEELPESLEPGPNEWSYSSKMLNDDEVLEGLEPHRYLKSLSIRNFRGEKFPSWFLRSVYHDGLEYSFLLDNLVELNLFNCMNCKSLPSTLGKLHNLKILEIKKMNSVKNIDSGFYSDASPNDGAYEVETTLFPALKQLTLDGMESLEEWWEPSESSPTVVFPCLEDLTIGCCPKLEKVPMRAELSSLQTLTIYSCNQLSSIDRQSALPTDLRKISIQGCPNLRSIPSIRWGSFLKEIKLKNCGGLARLPEGLTDCISLENLVIRDCSNLKYLPSMELLSSLRILVLKKCDRLKRLPDGLGFCTSLEQLDILTNFNLKVLPGDLRELCSLRFLNITICPNLKTFPDCLGYFSNLKVLTIGGFSEKLQEFPGLSSICMLRASLDCLLLLGWKTLRSLPNQLQCLTALKRLEIWSFERVEALPDWLGHISSLQSLKIHQCENLKYLPSIRAMQQLTQLKRLFIHNCPELRRRCAKESDPEWSKISHIPEVIIKNDD
ncbi:hypothetical protein REPUB_Repub15cG0137800 [Reevesia pubescens]